MTNTQQRLAESFRELGLSDAQARIAAAGRDPVGPSGFDGLAATFRGLGMTEAAAVRAAVGRSVSESQARVAFDEASRVRARPVVRAASAPATAARSSKPVRSPVASGAGARKPTGGRVMVREVTPLLPAAEPSRAARLDEIRECLTRPGASSIRDCVRGPGG